MENNQHDIGRSMENWNPFGDLNEPSNFQSSTDEKKNNNNDFFFPTSTEETKTTTNSFNLLDLDFFDTPNNNNSSNQTNINLNILDNDQKTTNNNNNITYNPFLDENMLINNEGSISNVETSPNSLFDDFFKMRETELETKETNKTQKINENDEEEEEEEEVEEEIKGQDDKVKDEDYDEDKIIQSFERSGYLDKYSNGIFGEKWKQKWVVFKENMFCYYENRADTNYKYAVHIDECDISVKKQVVDIRHSFQIINQRRNFFWVFSSHHLDQLNQWTKSLYESKKFYENKNKEITIMEMILLLSCTRRRTVERYRAFNFFTSKRSSGHYAIAACILMELILRECIDIDRNTNIMIHEKAKFQGVGILDDTIKLLSSRLKREGILKLEDFVQSLVNNSLFGFGEPTLDQPVLRSIDMAVRRGYLKIGSIPKQWVVNDSEREKHLIDSIRYLTSSQYKGTNKREHLALGVAYTFMRAVSRTNFQIQEVIDRLKIFPDVKTKGKYDQLLTNIAKNLGPFEKRHTTILKVLYSMLIADYGVMST